MSREEVIERGAETICDCPAGSARVAACCSCRLKAKRLFEAGLLATPTLLAVWEAALRWRRDGWVAEPPLSAAVDAHVATLRKPERYEASGSVVSRVDGNLRHPVAAYWGPTAESDAREYADRKNRESAP